MTRASPQTVTTEEASPRWLQTVQRANADFRVGRVQRSVRLYARAEKLLDEQFEGRALNAALLLAKCITVQNLAVALRHLGDSAAAERNYERLHALLYAIQMDARQTDQLRAMAMRQCRMTMQEWAASASTQGLHPHVIH